MTNGDKIRQMSDEQLSTWLTRLCVNYAMQTIRENNLIKYVNPPSDAELQNVKQVLYDLLRDEVQEDG